MPNPTPKTLSILSAHVYDDPKFLPTLPHPWEPFIECDEFLRTNGYFGRVYRNPDTNEFVIAHRGTDSKFYDIDDSLAHFLEKRSQQFTESALPFLQALRTTLSGEPHNLSDPVIYHTGHSLGGCLAQMTAAYEHVQGRTIHETCVFDSPGATLALLEDAAGSPLSDPNVLRDSITNYVARPNWINTKNEHFVKLVGIYPPFDVGRSGTTYHFAFPNSFSRQQHAIEGIVGCFDPTTGQPKVYSEPTTWPATTIWDAVTFEDKGEAWFRSLADNPHYWMEYSRLTGRSLQDIAFIDPSMPGGQDIATHVLELTTTPSYGSPTIHVTQPSQKVFGTTLGDDEVVSDHDSISVYKYGGGDLLKNKNLSFSTLCWESRKIKIKKAA